jgi:hypothetical protein
LLVHRARDGEVARSKSCVDTCVVKVSAGRGVNMAGREVRSCRRLVVDVLVRSGSRAVPLLLLVHPPAFVLTARRN